MLARASTTESAGTGAELWRDIVRRLTWAAVVSNVLGALALFILLGFLIPFAPAWEDRELGLNTAVGTAYLVVTLILGMRWGARLSAPVEQWLVEERSPTPEERARAIGIPFRFAAISGVFWFLGAVLITAINIPTSGWAALVVGGAIVAGGETTCAVGYLIVERLVRPITMLALAGGDPPEQCFVPGVRGRISMAWSLGTGIPLLGVLVLAAGGLTDPNDDPAFLAAAIAFLAAVGLLVGMYAINVASRSIAEPLAAVRHGMARVEEGVLDVSVPVDDGSEVGLLEAGFNRMAAGLSERERLRDLFGRHVGREVAEAALEQEGFELGGELREVGVVFVDILGSTALAARRPPAEVVAVLNDFFRIVVDAVEVHGGWVNKFEGDAALCVFGAPTRRPDVASDALCAARLLRERLSRDLPTVDAGIGVSAGAAVAGNVGTERRYEYTVIGDPVNEAARLCELAKRRPERVLASAAVVERTGGEEAAHWECHEESVTLRGRDEPTRLATPRTGPPAPVAEAGAAANVRP